MSNKSSAKSTSRSISEYSARLSNKSSVRSKKSQLSAHSFSSPKSYSNASSPQKLSKITNEDPEIIALRDQQLNNPDISNLSSYQLIKLQHSLELYISQKIAERHYVQARDAFLLNKQIADKLNDQMNEAEEYIIQDRALNYFRSAQKAKYVYNILFLGLFLLNFI